MSGGCRIRVADANHGYGYSRYENAAALVQMVLIGAVLAFSAVANRDKVGAVLFTDRIEGFAAPGRGSVVTTFFGVLIIVAVYLPIFTLQGLEAKMFQPMALTVTGGRLTVSTATALVTAP